VILESVRIISDWLQDATYGVNAKLAGVPLDGSDTVPPDIVTFLEETTSGVVARGRLPEDEALLPCLAVLQRGAVELPATVGTSHQEGDVPIAIWYGARDKDSEDGRKDAYYTMRAVRRSLRELFKDDATPKAARSDRSGISLSPSGTVSLQPVFTLEGDTSVSAALELTVKARDSSP